MKVSSGTLLSIAIAVLACASTIAVLATRDVASSADSQGRERSLLPTFRSEDVTRLELVSGGQKIAIERQRNRGRNQRISS